MVMKERRRRPRQSADAQDKGHESDFIRQGDVEFKVMARRNKLLGLWAAERMRITGEAAEAYAKEVIASALEKPGDDDLLRKVMKDFADKGADMTEARLREEMDALLDLARQQVPAEQR